MPAWNRRNLFVKLFVLDEASSGSTTALPPAHERIARFITRARFEDLPAAVVEKAKAQIVYHFGLAFAGLRNYEAEQMRRVAAQLNQPAGGASVIGEKYRLFTSDAAFANCTLMRAIWRDDVVFPAGVHPGIMTLPTALAVGEKGHSSGEQLILSMVLGYEVLGKLGSAAIGWAAPMPRRDTMIFGGYGPVVVAGKLLGLSETKFANALGYAANLCMGVPEGGQVDHFYSLITRNATFAADLAATGGAPYGNATLEGEFGLYRAFWGEVPENLDALIAAMGTDWEILRAEHKRHYGTGQNTVAIELMLQLARDNTLTPDNVANIDIVLHSDRSQRAENLFRGPFSEPGEAYSSMPFALAVVLANGQVTERSYSDAEIRSQNINAIVQKTRIRFESDHANPRYCRLEIETSDGRRLVGSSDRFAFAFPQEDWKDWLYRDGAEVLPEAKLDSLLKQLVALDTLDDVAELMATVRSDT